MAYHSNEFNAYLELNMTITIDGVRGPYNGTTGLNDEYVCLGKPYRTFKVAEIKSVPELDAEKTQISDMVLGIQGGWSSSCMIKAGRPLGEGEMLTAFMIDRVDGDIRKIGVFTTAPCACKCAT